MPGTSLAQKLKLKPGARAAVINAPDGYLKELDAQDVSVYTSLDGTYDWLQVFVRSQSELAALMGDVKAALKPSGLLWLAFPKGSSGIQTDLTRDRGWDTVKDLKWITLVSINETWSAFSLRLYRTGEEKQSFR